MLGSGGQQTFRLLCALSFAASVTSISAATAVLFQAAISDTRGYSSVAYHAALTFFLGSLILVTTAALVGVLSFLQFSYGIAATVGVSICMLVIIGIMLLLRRREDPKLQLEIV